MKRSIVVLLLLAVAAWAETTGNTECISPVYLPNIMQARQPPVIFIWIANHSAEPARPSATVSFLDAAGNRRRPDVVMQCNKPVQSGKVCKLKLENPYGDMLCHEEVRVVVTENE